MRFLLLLITMAVCLTACDHRQPSSSILSDAEVQKKLAGTWRGKGEYGVCTFVVASNGDYAAQTVFTKAALKRPNDIRNLSTEGTWIIKDGVLIATCTKSNASNAPLYLPMIDRLTIVRLDDRELVTRYDGQRPEIFEMVYQRVMK